MIRLVKAFDAWRAQRFGFLPECWAEVRARGKGQFVLRKGFSFTVLMVAFHDVFTHFFYHGGPFRFDFYIIQYWIMGIFFAYGVWSDEESKYKKALSASPPNDRLITAS